jgi:hypothetical protein
MTRWHRDFRVTGLEPVNRATGDDKNYWAAASSPLSPVSPLKMKSQMRQNTECKPNAFSTSDTGDAVHLAGSFGGRGHREFSRINPMNQDRVIAQLANIRAAARCGV